MNWDLNHKGFFKSHAGYVAICEQTRTGYSAYVPDLPICCAAGPTLPLTKHRMREAIKRHIQGLKEDGVHILRPRTLARIGSSRPRTLASIRRYRSSVQ